METASRGSAAGTRDGQEMSVIPETVRRAEKPQRENQVSVCAAKSLKSSKTCEPTRLSNINPVFSLLPPALILEDTSQRSEVTY